MMRPKASLLMLLTKLEVSEPVLLGQVLAVLSAEVVDVDTAAVGANP